MPQYYTREYGQSACHDITHMRTDRHCVSQYYTREYGQTACHDIRHVQRLPCHVCMCLEECTFLYLNINKKAKNRYIHKHKQIYKNVQTHAYTANVLHKYEASFAEIALDRLINHYGRRDSLLVIHSSKGLAGPPTDISEIATLQDSNHVDLVKWKQVRTCTCYIHTQAG